MEEIKTIKDDETKTREYRTKLVAKLENLDADTLRKILKSTISKATLEELGWMHERLDDLESL